MTRDFPLFLATGCGSLAHCFSIRQHSFHIKNENWPATKLVKPGQTSKPTCLSKASCFTLSITQQHFLQFLSQFCRSPEPPTLTLECLVRQPAQPGELERLCRFGTYLSKSALPELRHVLRTRIEASRESAGISEAHFMKSLYIPITEQRF